MRGNGLSAMSYAPVADLDPRIADVLLELLRDAGVAAYAQPSPGRRAATLDVHLPSRPIDRLYVDRSQQDRARLLVAEQLPELRHLLSASLGEAARDERPSTREDEAWQEIVATFDQPTGDAVPRWPVIEDVDPETPSGAPAAEPVATRLAGPRAGAHPPAEDEHFVPPPPPPLPRPDPLTRLAWAGMVGGPVLLLVTTLTGWVLPRVIVAAAVVAFVAGFVTLVVRMKNGPPEDWGSDSGAVL